MEEENSALHPLCASSQEGVSVDRVLRNKRSKSLSNKPTLNKNNGLEEDGVDAAQTERKILYDLHLKAVKEAFEATEKNWNDKTVTQTKQFMRRAQQILLMKEQTTTPVAFVPSGLSMEEDNKIFDMIEAETLHYTSTFAKISSSKCPNVKVAFQTICKQLNSPESTTPRALRDEIHSRFEGEPEMIGILVEKAEYFTKNVFPELLQLLCSTDLPFLFIIGVSHCVGNFDRFIPSNCSTAFVYSAFETVSTTRRLDEVLYKILDPCITSFTLDGKVVKYLSQHFQSQHASVTRLFQAYKICLMEHYRKPESVLCRIPFPASSALFDDTLSSIAKLDDIPTGNIMTKTINQCWKHIAHWNFTLRIICFIHSSLHSVSPIDVFKDLYVSCASGSFFEAAEGEIESPCKRFLTDIKNLSKSGLTRVINQLCQNLGLDRDAIDQPQITSLRVLHSNVSDITDYLKEIKDDLEKLDEKERLAAATPKSAGVTRIKLRKGITRDELKQTLKEEIATQSGSKPFNDFRDVFLKFTENLIKTNLKPFGSLLKGVHHKAFIFDDLQTLKSLFSPDPFSYVTNSLLLPAEVLNCKCCHNVSVNSNVHSLPDTCIVFKLLKEQTNKKVDLNNLFQAFLSILETEEVPGRGRKSIKHKKLDQDSCLLRFRQSVAELQFSGVLKRSRTNPDEITKLVWF